MKKVMAPIPPGQQNKDLLFGPGVSGNPKGRPKGARNRLSEAFYKDMLADWEVHGIKAIEKFREERPHEYVKVVAGLTPKEFNMKVSELDELSDEQIERQLAAVLAQLAEAGVHPGAGAAAEDGQEPPEPLSTVQ